MKEARFDQSLLVISPITAGHFTDSRTFLSPNYGFSVQIPYKDSVANFLS